MEMKTLSFQYVLMWRLLGFQKTALHSALRSVNCLFLLSSAKSCVLQNADDQSIKLRDYVSICCGVRLRGRWMLDFESVSPEFQSYSEHFLDLFHGCPGLQILQLRL